MKTKSVICCFLLTIWTSSAIGELNTLQYVSHDGEGRGRLDINGTHGQLIEPGLGPIPVDLSTASNYTLLDGEGGDMWNGGDQFTYLYDSNRVTGDFTATVRVVAQTQSVEGRWGKAGLSAQANLSGLGQNATADVITGTGSQADPPASGDHSPVFVRMGGRTGNEGQGGFERTISNASGPIPNNVFAESKPLVHDPFTNVSWLRLQYKAETNTFVAGYALDENGKPGEWGYSDLASDIPPPSQQDGDGWFVGIHYSAQNSMLLDELSDPDSLHGITYDNYSLVNEFLKPEVSIGTNEIGVLQLVGTPSILETGPLAQRQGLSQYWFSGNMRPGTGGVQAFRDVGTTGNDDFPLINPGGVAIVTPNTWWRGSNSEDGLTEIDLPAYPVAVEASDGWTGNNYGVKLQGEIFIPENGEYVIRDGIDDFAMVAIDADGNGELDGLADLPNDFDGLLFGESIGDVHVLDDDWANIDGGSQEPATHGLASIENIEPGGEWRRIEVWMSEGGGGDAGIVYLGNSEDPLVFSVADDGALSQAERDRYVIGPESLRSTSPQIVRGESIAALDPDLLYLIEANAVGADRITVDDGSDHTGNELQTTLDVSNATVRVETNQLPKGTSIEIFDADNIIGTDTMTLELADPTAWDLSNLSEGILTFEASLCDATTGGDLNGDGTVDFADFQVLSDNYGNFTPAAGQLLGDINCDATVSFTDFLILESNFGSVVRAEAASVPEPSTFPLLFAGLLFGLVRQNLLQRTTKQAICAVFDARHRSRNEE